MGVMTNKEYNEKVTAYFKEWDGFDFFAEMSDDYSVTRVAKRRYNELKVLAKGDPVLTEILLAFNAYNQPYGNSPFPKVEEYLKDVEGLRRLKERG